MLLLRLYICFVFLVGAQTVWAQGRIPGMGGRGLPRTGGGGTTDSLQRRNKNEDSVTIYYRYLDSVQQFSLDTSINDFRRRFPVPVTYQYLGNPGQAARSMLLGPEGRGGFDAGFHVYDVYKWTPEQARFFNTTRPYTELGYMLGSQTQQLISILQTQNIKPTWNVTLQYRLISSPGFFANQRTNHNNYLLSSWYAAKRKRYNNYFVLAGNKLQAAENGGIRDDQDYLNDERFTTRTSIPTALGSQEAFTRNFFGAAINTGRLHRELYFLLRQQYDIGKKDSLVTDSTVIPLFYPRLRFEHTLRYTTSRFSFKDETPDTGYYKRTYNVLFPVGTDTIGIADAFRDLTNDFSIYQFPDARNLQQYIKLGAAYQLINGTVRQNISLYNIYAHGEYRNVSRNKKWDITARAQLWTVGYNSGDYHAYASLQRLLSSKLGALQLGFENINRSPSFVYDNRSNFYLANTQNFGKENWTHAFGAINNSLLKLQLKADYYLVSNYLYFTGFFKPQQESSLFTLLRISASKRFDLRKRLHLYTDIWVQQKTGNVALNVPLVLTRNRLMYEGTLGFPNLRLAAGIEARYHTPYKADGYSPLLGQFQFQDTTTITNRPDADLFVHFRIRRLSTYFRLENLNTASTQNGFGFTRNNLAAPLYPYPGLVIRLGIFWTFVN